MKTRFQIAGFLYVSLALLTAYQSVASTEEMVKKRAGERNVISKVERPVQDNQRLDGLRGDGIGPYDPSNLPEPKPESEEPKGKAAYTVRVWSADWCYPCTKWKKKELPTLLKAGYKVQVLDYDKDKPPKDIKAVPTVILLYKGEEVYRQNYWTAKDIDKYVDNRMSLKQ